MIVITLSTINVPSWGKFAVHLFFETDPRYQYENWHWTYSRDGIVNVLSLTIYKRIYVRCTFFALSLPIVLLPTLKIILHVFVLFWFYLSSWPPSKSGSCESNKHDDLMQWWQHPFYALFYNTLFRKYRFILDELLMRVASKFAITFGGRWKHNFFPA